MRTCLQVMMGTKSSFSFPNSSYFASVNTGPNKRSVNEKVAKKSSADKQLQLPSVPIGLGQKQVSSELPHRQPTTISIPPATGIYAIFTSFQLLLRFLDCH